MRIPSLFKENDTKYCIICGTYTSFDAIGEYFVLLFLYRTCQCYYWQTVIDISISCLLLISVATPMQRSLILVLTLITITHGIFSILFIWLHLTHTELWHSLYLVTSPLCFSLSVIYLYISFSHFFLSLCLSVIFVCLYLSISLSLA